VYHATRECNTFSPALARWVIETTAGRGARVLDPSAGWGDRLLGALAAGAACYHGWDPNPRLQAGYAAIVAAHGGGNARDFWVREAPFEAARPAAGKYDVALTSPPFYDYEVYVAPGEAGGAAQSLGAGRTYAEWAAQVYRPYLANMYRAVRPGGWLVVYIDDVKSRGAKLPLRALTRATLAGCGARAAGAFGLRIAAAEATRRRGRPPPPVKWAEAWRKPKK
jgi:hypothetical protein